MDANEQVPQDDNQEVIEPEVVEEIQAEEPIQEEVPEEAPEEPEVAEEPVAPAPEEPQPSRRESLRIQQLIQKMKEPEPQRQTPMPSGIDYSEALDTTQEVAQMLHQDREQYGQAMRQDALEQVKSIQFHTRLDIDSPRIESKYPVLDPSDKENFSPAIADALNVSYLNTVGYDHATDTVKNSNVRYGDYIEAQMELARAIAGDRNAKTVQNVAKQAATTGLRPDGSKAKSLNLNQDPQDMTDEELIAVISKGIK